LLYNSAFDGSPIWKAKQDHFSALFTQLEFIKNEPFSLSSSPPASKSIALTQVKQFRMQRIFEYLLEESIVPITICLTGRSYIFNPEEKTFLTSKMDVLSSEMDILSDENQNMDSKKILNDEAEVTESIAYPLLCKSWLRN